MSAERFEESLAHVTRAGKLARRQDHPETPPSLAHQEIDSGRSKPSGVEIMERVRIGQFSPLSNGRVRFELDNGKDLRGLIVAQKKNRTADVLIGEYTEMDGQKKTGRQWQVELRPIED